MALTYAIDPSKRLVVITGEYATQDDWRELLAAVLRDPAYQRGFSFLRDLRKATTPVDADTVARIVDVVRAAWGALGPERAAIVTPRDMQDAAMVAHALADDAQMPIRAFTSYEAALDWLGKE